MKNKWGWIRGLTGAVFLGFFLFWLLCLNHVSVNEIGVAYNSLNGELTYQETPGWYLTKPTTKVINLPLLPMRVEIYGSSKLINAKIIRLVPSGIPELIKREGFSYNLSDGLAHRLTGYAFSGQTFPFIEVLQEAKP